MSSKTFLERLQTALTNTNQADLSEDEQFPPKKDGEKLLGTAPGSFQALWALGDELKEELLQNHEQRHANLAPGEPCDCEHEFERFQERMSILENLRWQILKEEFDTYKNNVLDIALRGNWEVVEMKPSEEPEDLMSGMPGMPEGIMITVVGVGGSGEGRGGGLGGLFDMFRRN